jgi:hypothetical protein
MQKEAAKNAQRGCKSKVGNRFFSHRTVLFSPSDFYFRLLSLWALAAVCNLLSLDTPDMQCAMGEDVFVNPETAKFNPPGSSWSFAPCIVRPKSRDFIAGPNLGSAALTKIDKSTTEPDTKPSPKRLQKGMSSEIVCVGYKCPICARHVVVLRSCEPKLSSSEPILSECNCGYYRPIYIADLQSLDVWRETTA